MCNLAFESKPGAGMQSPCRTLAKRRSASRLAQTKEFYQNIILYGGML